MSDELKPCPFCGGEAILYDFFDGGRCMVECGNPDCAAPYTRIQPSKAAAIAAWNTRATQTTHAVIVYGATVRCKCELCGEPINQWDHYCKWCGAEVER